MLLLRGGTLWSPDHEGKVDILIGGESIVGLGESLVVASSLVHRDIDVRRCHIVPGFIDCHCHIAGAGGEGGPATRTPQLQLSEMTRVGITTVIGCLGTDGYTRTVESVLMKAKGLRAEGLSSWIYTGSYQVPSPTITGDLGRDLALIEEVIGVGEIAIADHRSSFPTIDEFLRLASKARVGGMLGGKSGIVNCHLGDSPNPFQLLYEVAKTGEIPLTQFLPTHCNRNSSIFEDSCDYGKRGFIDITTSSYPAFSDIEVKPSIAVKELLQAGVPLEHITFSSDGGGSLPSFDEQGKLEHLERGDMGTLFREVRDLIMEEGFSPDKALPFITSNPATILGLSRKGEIRLNADADFVVLDEDWTIKHVVARGQLVVEDGRPLILGTYERE